MATVIDSLFVTLGLDTRGFKKGASEAKKVERDLVTSSDENTKKMASGFAAVRKEVMFLAGAFFAATGAAKFFANTITSAASLGYLAENLNISTERINAFQRASERMNGSASGMTAQLKESVDTLAQLKSGLGPSESLQWFFRMGGSSEDLKDGNTYLLARSKIVHDLFQADPGKAALMARQMGIVEDQFDLIKQGPDAILALVAAQEKNSAVTAQNAKEAQELLRRWLDFTDAIKGTFMKAVLALAPAITIILEKFVEWANQLANNKDAIQDFGNQLTNFLTKTDWSGIIKDAKEFAASVSSIATSIKDVIDRWDEWRGKPKLQTPGVTYLPGAMKFGKTEDVSADAVARGRSPSVDGRPKNETLRKISDSIEMGIARTLASFGVQAAKEYVRDVTGKDDYLAGPKTTAPKQFNSLMEKSKYAVSKLVSMGWTQAQAAGMVGSLMQESNLDEGAINPKSGAYGAAQWLSKDRIANFEKWAKQPLVGSSFDKQLEFMNYELTKGSEGGAGDALRAAKTAEQAAELHRRLYERPGEAEANDPMRRAFARQIEKNIQQTRDAANAPQSSSGAGSSTSETTINGGVNIYTQAKDADGIAKEIKPGIVKYTSSMNANSGVK